MRHSGIGALACVALLAACSGDSEQCDNGGDDDANGLADCADPACPAGTACAAGGLVCADDQTCSRCTGNGGRAEPDGETSCSDGFDNDCDGSVDCADPSCPETSCTIGGGQPAVLGSLRVASIQHAVMGARSSGFQEQNAIVFEALDVAGRPYRAGLTVTFTHPSQGGSYVGPIPSCGPGPVPTCLATAQTDAQGRATVLLTAGRRFAFLSVRAEARADGVTVAAIADDVVVVGAKPNGAHLGLDCRPWNVPALSEHDCMVSKYAGPGSTVDCTLTFGDRHGLAIGIPTLAAFWTEAGVAGPPVFSPSWQTDAEECRTEACKSIGRAVSWISVLGQPLPWDVPPLADEHGVFADFGCEPRFANPRDGLVTVIGLVAGEEGFVDLDGDGEYTAGEPFVDLGEPFIDADDDGVRDEAEPFQDVDEDGRYTGPNARWDADTVLWTQTRIVYTGQPAFATLGGRHVYSRIYDKPLVPPPGDAPFATLPATPFADDTTYGVYFADENFNPLSGLATYGASTAYGNATADLPFLPGAAEPLGAGFRLLYCDAAEASCAYGPAASACTTTPCHVVPDVSGFTYGTRFDLAVDCTRSGPDVAYVTADLNGVGSTMSVAGVCP